MVKVVVKQTGGVHCDNDAARLNENLEAYSLENLSSGVLISVVFLLKVS